jgi:uncharacterized RDD family membrane protein YckC
MTEISPAVGHLADSRACPACGRGWGVGVACQFCDQVDGLPTGVHLSGVGRRLGAHVLDVLLLVLTLILGWIIWSAIIWSRGQSPGKQILGMRVVHLRTGRRATWGRMFLREIIAKTIIGFLALFTFGVLNFWLVWDKNKQELWDKVAGTVVVNDPQAQLIETDRPALQAATA